MSVLTSGLEKLVHFTLYGAQAYGNLGSELPSGPSSSVDLRQFDGDIVLTLNCLNSDTNIGVSTIMIQSSDDDGVSDPFTDIPGLTLTELSNSGIEVNQALVFDQGRSKRFLRANAVTGDDDAGHFYQLIGFGVSRY